MICRYCGADNNENRKTCKSCKRQLYDDIWQAPQNQQADGINSGAEFDLNLPKKKKNTLIWICAGAGTVAAIAIVVIIVVLAGTAKTSNYSEKLAQADRYAGLADYDSAIQLYTEAIEMHPNNPDAYIKLVNVYISINDLTNARMIAQKGAALTKNDVLKNMLNMLLGDDAQAAASSNVIAVDSEMVNAIATLTYSDLVSRYGTAIITNEKEGVRAEFESGGITAYYALDAVDTNTNQPKPEVYVDYVLVKEPKFLIQNYGGYLPNTAVKDLFGNTVQIVTIDGIQCISVDYLNCMIYIQCDDNGDLTGDDIYIKIVPSLAGENNDNGLKGEATGKVTQEHTAEAVANAHIVVRAGADMKNGAVVAETDTNARGEYTLSLPEGKYTLCITKSGFEEKYFTITINKGMTMPNQDVALLEANDALGEIKLVLEWGSDPKDLDLHVSGMTKANTFISVFGRGGRYMSFSENGKVIAKLDKNDTDGNGKETITLSGSALGGNYEVHVHDQTNRGGFATKELSNSGAVLSIYLPNESTPHIYNIETDKEGTCWYPCDIVNDEIIERSNGTMRYSTIG